TGFLLSFSATAGIILLKEPFDRLLKRDLIPPITVRTPRSVRCFRRTLMYFFDLTATTLAATLSTLPLVIRWFGGQSLLAVPLNLVAVPIAMLAYPLSLAVTLLSLLLPRSMAFAAVVPDRLYALLTSLVRGTSSLGLGRMHVPNYPAWLFLAHIVIFISASCVTRIRPRIRKVLAPSLVLLVAVSMGAAWIDTLGFTMTFLDAGQADATVLAIDGKVFIYDTGEPYTPVEDFVSGAYLGVDAVFLSHPHYDHAGGLVSLLNALPPRVIYVPKGWFEVEPVDAVKEGIELAQSMDIPIIELAAGDSIVLTPRATATIYGPDGLPEDENDMSLLVEIERDGASVFLTGDLTAKGEPAVMPDVDLLRVPHHGSAKSTDDALVGATSPDIAIISVGDNNYGHPTEEVLERLRAAGARIYRTDRCGAITVRPKGDGYHVETYLDAGGEAYGYD
ncbi:MAG: MBL fold metallo-hydrolase, partial [Clostridiales bacterium]|nr:MBL fold metallo-hydrolase [Clostridiales bacterium]